MIRWELNIPQFVTEMGYTWEKMPLTLQENIQVKFYELKDLYEYQPATNTIMRSLCYDFACIVKREIDVYGWGKE